MFYWRRTQCLWGSEETKRDDCCNTLKIHFIDLLTFNSFRRRRDDDISVILRYFTTSNQFHKPSETSYSSCLNSHFKSFNKLLLLCYKTYYDNNIYLRTLKNDHHHPHICVQFFIIVYPNYHHQTNYYYQYKCKIYYKNYSVLLFHLINLYPWFTRFKNKRFG